MTRSRLALFPAAVLAALALVAPTVQAGALSTSLADAAPGRAAKRAGPRAQAAVVPVTAAPRPTGSLRAIALAALHHDPRFAEADARIDAARYGVAVADAGDKLTASFAGDIGRSELRTDARFPESGLRNPNSLGVQATQPLYNGGRSDAERAAAGFALDAAGEARRDVGGKLILAALTAALDYKRDRESLRLAEASHATLDAARGDVNLRYRAGEATTTDLAQADARRAEADAGVKRATAQLRSDEIRLARLVGGLPPAALDVAWPASGALPTAATRDAAVALSQKAPAVVAAERQQRSARATVEAVRATARPQFSLGASAGTQDDSDFGYERLSNWRVALQVNVPILTGGLVRARVGEAKARAVVARSVAEDEAAEYAEAAAREWELLQAGEAVIAATRAQVTAAEAALDGVRKELRVGSRVTLDLLDAERELLAAQVQLVSAERDRAVTAFTLLAACGVLELENVPD